MKKEEQVEEGQQGMVRQRVCGLPAAQGLYDPHCEHDACGVGFLAHIDGRKSHDIIEKGVVILKNLLHRGATGGGC